MAEPLIIPTAKFSPFPERAIRTYEDWRAYASNSLAVSPPLPSATEFAAMSKNAKTALNHARTYYHNSFGPILVPAMEKIHTAALRLAAQNLRAQPGARPGIIMDGLSTVGKSTIAMQLGRRYERLVTKNFTITTSPSGQTFIPVAFVNLPGESNIMNFNRLLAKFYNIPFSESRVKEGFLTSAIEESAADCATSMIILDDIHFLRIKNRSHKVLNNHFKHLATTISATFIYAGVGIKASGLMDEGNSVEKAEYSQTRHRFKKFDLMPYRFDTDKSRTEFLGVLSSFESNLLLFNQHPGSLAKEAGEYIYARTSGFLGPISTLVREAASLAIKSGEERITVDAMETIKLDYDSEQYYELHGKQIRAATQKAET